MKNKYTKKEIVDIIIACAIAIIFDFLNPFAYLNIWNSFIAFPFGLKELPLNTGYWYMYAFSIIKDIIILPFIPKYPPRGNNVVYVLAREIVLLILFGVLTLVSFAV